MKARRALRVLRDPRRGVKRLDRFLAPILGRDDFTRFIVLSRSRTGSNLLASLLNSHPHAFVEGGDVLARLDGFVPQEKLPRRACSDASECAPSC